MTPLLKNLAFYSPCCLIKRYINKVIFVWQRNKKIIGVWNCCNQAQYFNKDCNSTHSYNRKNLSWNYFFYYNFMETFPTDIYLFKVNNRNAGKRCKICSKLTVKTLYQGYWRHSGAFIVNLEHISHLFSAFQILAGLTEKISKYIVKGQY